MINVQSLTAGSKLHQAIIEGFDSLHKYIHSGDLEEISDLVPYEDFEDYTAEDFIEDHATLTVGDEEDAKADPYYEEEDHNNDYDQEPSAKRFRGDFDPYENDGSNDADSRYGPGIPSLLNLNVENPRYGRDGKNAAQKSPTVWENSSSNNNGAFGNNQNNSNNKPSGNNKDRRARGSRWR